MNNDDLKKKIVDIALHAEWTDMFGDHNSIGKYAANAIADALIAAGIGDVKEVEKEYRNVLLLVVKSQTLASEISRYMELNKNIAKHRAEVAERALAKFAFTVECDDCPFRDECGLDGADIERCYEEYIRISEKELAEERKDD